MENILGKFDGSFFQDLNGTINKKHEPVGPHRGSEVHSLYSVYGKLICDFVTVMSRREENF